MDRLKNKRALITGGTTGIGLETARQFLIEGARVAVTGSNPATLEAAREELGATFWCSPQTPAMLLLRALLRRASGRPLGSSTCCLSMPELPT